MNPYSDISFEYQELFANVPSHWFDGEVAKMLGLDIRPRTYHEPVINPYSDYNPPVSWSQAELTAEWESHRVVADWSTIRQEERLFREGKYGYSMGDGVLKRWGSKIAWRENWHRNGCQ